MDAKNGLQEVLLCVLIHAVITVFSGYALKDVAVFYIMRSNPEVFSRLGRNWDGDEDSYCHVSVCATWVFVQFQLFITKIAWKSKFGSICDFRHSDFQT